MKYEFDYQKLKGKIVEKTKNQENLANQMGVTKQSLNQKLNNKVAFKQSDIVTISTLLEISKVEIPEYFFTLKV